VDRPSRNGRRRPPALRTLAILPGAGHIGPLLRRPPATADLITAFWREPEATITALRCAIAAASG